MAKQNRPEDQAHKAIAQFLAILAPRGVFGAPFIWHHSPNQRGTRAKWENAMLKAMGVLPGFADFIIIGPGAKCYFGEVKPLKGDQSDAQWDFERDLYNLCGHEAQYDIWHDIDECKASLQKWGLI